MSGSLCAIDIVAACPTVRGREKQTFIPFPNIF